MTLREDVKDIEKEVNDIKETSWAMEILHDYQRANKRMFIIVIILLISLLASIGYTIYTLNTVSTVDVVDVEQDNDNGDNNYIGNDDDINGKTKDKNN